MNKKSIISTRSCLVVGISVVILMLVGSFFDYQLSSSLYNEKNIFGLIFAAYGQLPSALAMSIGGGLWIYTAVKYKGIPNGIRAFFGSLLAIFGVFMGYYEPAGYLTSTPKLFLLVVSVLINFGSIYLVLMLVKKHGEHEMRRLAAFLIFFVVSQILVVNVIKVPWARPRMRFIQLYPEVEFANWWQIGSSIKDKYITMGVGSNEFKSFPSGHTASSLNILFVCVLARYSNFIKEKRTIVLGGALLFGVLTALSRIVLGAHFLTDVTVGFAITFILYYVSLKLFFNNNLNLK